MSKTKQPKIKNGYLYTNGKAVVHVFDVELWPGDCLGGDEFLVHYNQVNRTNAACIQVQEDVFLNRYPHRVMNIIIEVGDE